MNDKPTQARVNNSRIWRFAALTLVFLGLYYVLELGLIAHALPNTTLPWHDYQQLLKRLALALFAIMLILLGGRIVERIIDRSSHSPGVRYNLVRITRLISYLFALIIILAFLFQNLYAAAVSFGLISLVLGFALQAPIASFIGWLYIVFRRPYHVGDRIQLGTLRGDVLEVSYLDTRLRECSGDYLGNDRASGRIIHFPNSVILTEEVINYAGPTAPFIWNETALQIAFTSNLAFVENTLVTAADADFSTQYPQRSLDSDTHASVYFRVNERAWLEAVVAYPVEPYDTTGRRNRILTQTLPALNQQPDKVQFPAGTQR